VVLGGTLLQLIISLIFISNPSYAAFWGQDTKQMFERKIDCEAYNGSVCFEKVNCEPEYCTYSPAGFISNPVNKNIKDRFDAVTTVIKSWNCSAKTGDMRIVCRYLRGLANKR